MCDNVDATVADLAAKGAELTAPVRSWALGSSATAGTRPAGEIGLYQPKHPTAYDLGGGPATASR